MIKEVISRDLRCSKAVGGGGDGEVLIQRSFCMFKRNQEIEI